MYLSIYNIYLGDSNTPEYVAVILILSHQDLFGKTRENYIQMR